jgi:hypothetical protein
VEAARKKLLARARLSDEQNGQAATRRYLGR